MKAIFLGGDLRQKYACDYLNKNNIYSEFYSNFTLDQNLKLKIKDALIISLPIPILKDEKYLNVMGEYLINPYDILDLLDENNTVFGGKIPDSMKEYLANNNINYIDYFDIEMFQIQNALLSAEGAIYYAKQRIDTSISNLEIAILGFGRIGKILVYLLHSQGAKITVYARKESDFAWCKLMGLNAVKIEILGNKSKLDIIDQNYDIIYNTIPYRIMDENFAKKYNDNTIIIDLASFPYGVDELIVKEYKLKYYRESGIPGRYAPKSAGEIIAKTILNYISIKED